MTSLSDLGRLFVERWNLFAAAEALFWDEMRRIFEEAASAMQERGWVAIIFYNEHARRVRLRLRRPHWPATQDVSVHFQAGVDRTWLTRGRIPLHLAVLGDGAQQHQLFGWLQHQLQRYELTGSILRQTGCRVRRGTRHRLTRATYPLLDASSEGLLEALIRLTELAPFVDEALLLADKRQVWRTDFLPDDPLPEDMEPSSDLGGVRLSPNEGRLGTACALLTAQAGRSFRLTLTRLRSHPGERLLFSAWGRSNEGAALRVAMTYQGSGRALETITTETVSIDPSDWSHIVQELQPLQRAQTAAEPSELVVAVEVTQGEMFLDGIEIASLSRE